MGKLRPHLGLLLKSHHPSTVGVGAECGLRTWAPDTPDAQPGLPSYQTAGSSGGGANAAPVPVLPSALSLPHPLLLAFPSLRSPSPRLRSFSPGSGPPNSSAQVAVWDSPCGWGLPKAGSRGHVLKVRCRLQSHLKWGGRDETHWTGMSRAQRSRLGSRPFIRPFSQTESGYPLEPEYPNPMLLMRLGLSKVPFWRLCGRSQTQDSSSSCTVPGREMPKTHAETYQPSPDPLLGLRVMGPASHRSATGEEDFKTFSDKCQRSPGPSSLSKWQGLAWCWKRTGWTIPHISCWAAFPQNPP